MHNTGDSASAGDILDAIPQIVWTALPSGACSYLNRRWYQFTGQKKDLQDQPSFLAAVHLDDREHATFSWKESVRLQTDFEIRVRLQSAAGGFRWVVLHAVPDFRQNEISGWVGTCNDIHEQVLAEDALKQTEAMFRKSLDLIPHMTWTATAEGSHDYFSRSWYEFTGIQEGSADGGRWRALFHPDDQKRLGPRWQQSLQTGEPFEIEYRLLHRTGSYRWMLCRALAERDVSGRIVRWRGACTDIHEKVVAEQTLNDTESINRTILNATPDSIQLARLDGTILYANPPSGMVWGLANATSTFGMSWFELVTPEFSEAARDAVRRAIDTGDDQQIRVMQPKADGQASWLEILITLVVKTQEAPERLIIIARDVTEQHHAEQALRESERLHRGMLEASHDCIKIVSLEGRVELMNGPGVCAMELENLELVRGAKWLDFWPPESQPLVRKALLDAARGETVRFSASCPTARNTPKWWDVLVSPMMGDDGRVTRLLAISRDVTGQRKAVAEVKWASEHDPVTTLPNRRAFEAHLQAATIRAMQDNGEVGLLLLDLDHFKHVNDTLGHPAGDHLLTVLGERLRERARSSDFVARLGGDEFAVILEGKSGTLDPLSAGEFIVRRLQEPIEYDGRMIGAGVSIGGAIFPRDARSANELFNAADTALYALKESGRGGTRMFHNEMREQAQLVSSQLSLARNAINQDTVEPHYQQKVDLASGAIAGFEALLRWRHISQGIQSPDTVAEAFKDYDLASKIGDLMQRRVFSDLRGWLNKGYDVGFVAINAAPVEFLRDDYAERLIARMFEQDIPPELVEVEVTEHVFYNRGAEFVGRALKTLSQAGVRIALDDFGTGYSSLSHLRDFPVDVVKIDRTFIEKLTVDPSVCAIVSAVIELAKSLAIEVVAEGVETQAQRILLLQQGCDIGQGYLFGRAVDARKATRLLQIAHGRRMQAA